VWRGYRTASGRNHHHILDSGRSRAPRIAVGHRCVTIHIPDNTDEEFDFGHLKAEL
jgi:hypothetical protein